MVMEAIRTGFEQQQEIGIKRSNREIDVDAVATSKAIVGTLVRLAEKGDEDKKFDTAQDVLDVGLANIMLLSKERGKILFPSKTVEDEEKSNIRIGLLAETCAQITLKKLGFEIIEGTIEEDLDHGVDMYVRVPTNIKESEVWAISVKGYSSTETPQIYDLKTTAENTDNMSDRQYNKTLHSSGDLLKYVASKRPYAVHPEFDTEELYVRPVTLIIPSGKDTRAFKRNGEPIRADFHEQLLVEIEKAFPNVKASAASHLKKAEKTLETSIRA